MAKKTTHRKGLEVELHSGTLGTHSFKVEEAENILNNPKNNGSWLLPDNSKYQHVDGKIISNTGTGTTQSA